MGYTEVPQQGQVGYTEVPQQGQVGYTEVPQQGQVGYTEVPQQGQVGYTEVPQQGQVGYTEVPQQGQVGYTEVPQQGQEAIRTHKPVTKCAENICEAYYKCVRSNARSIVNKKKELNIMVEDIDSHIIGITQSWDNKDTSDDELGLTVCVMFIRDRI